MDPIERIYREWDQRWEANDAAGVLALYAADAVFESPLVPNLTGRERGVLRGHGELRPFFEQILQRKPASRGRYRAGYLTDGRVLFWEYPRQTPGDEQLDLAEVMEISSGLIQRHRVYWGWVGCRALKDDAYRK